MEHQRKCETVPPPPSVVVGADLICSGRPWSHRRGALGASDAPGIGTSWGLAEPGWTRSWGQEVAHRSVGAAPLSHTNTH